MKKGSIVIFLIILATSVFAVPIFINESYKINSGYVTLWEAKDLLSYFGAIISAIGTIFIGIIAIKQSHRANDISDRLLKLQEVSSTPFFNLDISGCKIQSLTEREIDILIGLKNETNSVINILEVSDIKADTFWGKQQLTIPFCKGWTTFYSVLPYQTKEINFFYEVKKNDGSTVDFSKIFSAYGFSQLKCEFELKLQSVNSSDTYTQKLEFYSSIIQKETQYKLIVFNIENSIEKME